MVNLPRILIDDFVLLPQLDRCLKREERHILIGQHVIDSVLEIEAVDVHAVDEFGILRLLNIFLDVLVEALV